MQISPNFCNQHAQEFIAVMIKQDLQKKNEYLCPQCLVEMINSKQLILISHAKELIQKKKIQISQNIKEKMTNRIKLMKIFLNNILQLQTPIESIFKTILDGIDQIMKESENAFNSSDIISPENLPNDFDLLINENSLTLKPEINEGEVKLIGLLVKVIKSIDIENLQNSALETLFQCYERRLIYDENLSQINNKNNNIKTPSLPFPCTKHNKEIIMIKIDQQQGDYQFTCVQCIQEVQGKYISLEQFQISFNEYQEKAQNFLFNFQHFRRIHSIAVKILCQNLKNQYDLKLNLQIQQLEQNYQSFNQSVEQHQEFNGLKILDLNLEQLQKLVAKVFQNQSIDHFSQVIKNQKEMDEIFSQQFLMQLVELIQSGNQKQHQIYFEYFWHQILLQKFGDQKCLENSNIFQGIQQFLNEKEIDYSQVLNNIPASNYQKQFLSKFMQKQDQQNDFSNQTILFEQILKEQLSSNEDDNLINSDVKYYMETLDKLQNKINLQQYSNQSDQSIQTDLTDECKDAQQQEIQRLKKKIADLELAILVFQQQQNVLKAKDQEIQKIQQEIENLNKILKESKNESTQLQNKLLELQNFSSEHDELKQKLISYDQKMKNQEQEIINLQNQMKSPFQLSNNYRPQFNNNLKYASNTFNSPKIVSSINGSYGLSVMTPALPQNQITSFAFKLNKFNSGWIGVGICHLETVQQNSFYMDGGKYSQINNGAYIIIGSGNRISSYQGYTSGTFSFGQDSIIICNYNPNLLKITFYHLNDGKNFQIDLPNNNQILCPCALLYSNSEIEFI